MSDETHNMIGFLPRAVSCVTGEDYFGRPVSMTFTPGLVDLRVYPDLRGDCFTQDDVDIITQCAAFFIAKDHGPGPDTDWLAGLASRIAMLLPPPPSPGPTT